MEKNSFKKNLHVDDFDLVEIALGDVNLDAYDQLRYLDFYEKFVETSKILLKIIEIKFDSYIKDTILRMAFVYSVTSMESYLKKASFFILEQKPQYLQKVFVELGCKPDLNSNFKEIVFKKINKHSLQNPEKISRLFSIFDIKTEVDFTLNSYVKLRNDITHQDKRPEEIQKILIDCIKRVGFFVGQINSEIQLSYFTEEIN